MLPLDDKQQQNHLLHNTNTNTLRSCVSKIGTDVRVLLAVSRCSSMISRVLDKHKDGRSQRQLQNNNPTINIFLQDRDIIKYIGLVFLPFLIQTATAATDPDYNFGYAAGTHVNTTHVNTTDNSQKICSGKSYGCIIGFFDGFKQTSHKQQIAAGLTEYDTGYDQGYKDGISYANTGDDIGTDEIPDICSHFTQQWCEGWQAGYKAGFWSVPNPSR